MSAALRLAFPPNPNDGDTWVENGRSYVFNAATPGWHLTGQIDQSHRDDADQRYLLKSGGQLTGPLIAASGSGPTNPGIGIGDNASGFYRAGSNSLQIALSGSMRMQFVASPAEAMLVDRLNMATQRILNLGDPTAGTDAANRNYVDQRRANSMLVDVLVDYPVTGGQWGTFYTTTYPIARGGNSRIQVTLSINIGGLSSGQMILAGARITGNPERRIFGYGVGNTPTGFTTELFADVTGTNPAVNIDLTSFDTGTTPLGYTVLGGGGGNRSQILITDLGPR